MELCWKQQVFYVREVGLSSKTREYYKTGTDNLAAAVPGAVGKVLS
jgi:hypothetical protein